MVRKQLFAFILSCGFCNSLFAQKASDSLLIKEVSIESSRLHLFSTGVKITSFDSTILKEKSNATLAELLVDHSTVYIKNYGGGSLATVSFRGTTASHTQLNWNGFPINSNTAGEADLALVPVSSSDKISLIHGSSASIFGSGAVGGTILLENEADWKKGIFVSLADEIGSFGSNKNRVNIDLGNEDFQSSTRYAYSFSENNFPFINTASFGSPKVYQSNAQVLQHNFNQSLSYKINEHNEVFGSLWYQYSSRQFAPLMTTLESSANQQDSSFRTFVGWKTKYRTWNITFKAAYFDEFLRYSDPEAALISTNRVRKPASEFEWHQQIGQKILINAGGLYNNAIADVDTYGKTIKEARGAFFAGMKYQFSPKWVFNSNIRKEIVKGYQPPLTPSVGFEGMILQGLYLKGNYSNSFSLPTLNEKYWQPGGNPNLKPEKGYTYELGLRSLMNFSGEAIQKLEAEITAYNSMIADWIEWTPGAKGVWSPTNLRKVKVYGLEANASHTLKYRNFLSLISLIYSYTISTNEDAYSPDLQSTLGKQLIYIPKNNFSANAYLSFRSFHINYSQHYSGELFTTSDNENLLPGYSIANLSLGKEIKLHSFKTILNLRILNLWDVSYQVLPWRAMPGRAYFLELKFEFNNRKPI